MTAPTHQPASHPRRTLVSGGAGFIGSHLADILLARGDHVTVVDNLSTGRRDNLPDSHPRLRFIEADLADALAVLGKGETFQEIYHLAAAVGVKLIIDQPIRSIETNVEQTAALLRFALTRSPNGGPAPTLIASSSEVYGKGTRVPFREDDDVLYGPTTVARWSYACSKAIDEYLALAYARAHNMPTVVARFFNTVGPRQVGHYGMVLPRFVHAALNRQPLDVHGDGLQSRCFCDVRDVADALPRLLAAPACHGRVLNVGSDRPITILALAELVCSVLHADSPIRRIPYREVYPDGFEDLRERRPDLTRIRDAIGFATRRSLEDTIRDVAASLSTAGLPEMRR
jgi:UDP-glucose 4-epimerase